MRGLLWSRQAFQLILVMREEMAEISFHSLRLARNLDTHQEWNPLFQGRRTTIKCTDNFVKESQQIEVPLFALKSNCLTGMSANSSRVILSIPFWRRAGRSHGRLECLEDLPLKAHFKDIFFWCLVYLISLIPNWVRSEQNLCSLVDYR